eukprot:CAMPEP_0174718154 /NCGR_PEP_ID=MMETSP1094-20130205/28159_1 /TAXON_ID=156173 /ORGANISM="Chrysochromulina brevifilum, Strain UTEX LB 985" /LENGTH=147 /DNA_ID=CAMNT_0015918195 /DNA_START=94 /DNA_END=537 /DNA_ORIENTATION=-
MFEATIETEAENHDNDDGGPGAGDAENAGLTGASVIPALANMRRGVQRMGSFKGAPLVATDRAAAFKPPTGHTFSESSWQPTSSSEPAASHRRLRASALMPIMAAVTVTTKVGALVNVPEEPALPSGEESGANASPRDPPDLDTVNA